MYFGDQEFAGLHKNSFGETFSLFKKKSWQHWFNVRNTTTISEYERDSRCNELYLSISENQAWKHYNIMTSFQLACQLSW